MSISEFNGPEIPPEPETSAIGAGSEIYRRMEQRQKPSSMKYVAPAVAVLVIAAAGGVFAYESMNKPQATPAPAAVSTPPPPPQAVAVNTPPPAPVVTQPPAAAPAAPAVREARAEPPRAERVIRHRATSAASQGEDTGAYAPPAPSAAASPPPTAVAPAPAPAISAPEASTPPPTTAEPAPPPETATPPAATPPAAAPSNSTSTSGQ